MRECASVKKCTFVFFTKEDKKHLHPGSVQNRGANENIQIRFLFRFTCLIFGTCYIFVNIDAISGGILGIIGLNRFKHL